jgi:hypothetical protein
MAKSAVARGINRSRGYANGQGRGVEPSARAGQPLPAQRGGNPRT